MQGLEQMTSKNPFAKLPADIRAKLLAADRMIPGYWSSAELTAALGLGRNAVFMRVKRGGLVPVDRSMFTDKMDDPVTYAVALLSRTRLMFTDKAVADYVLNPPKRGRPVVQRMSE